MSATRTAIVIMILAASIFLSRCQQTQSRRELLQQQLQEKMQQRQKAQLERQLARAEVEAIPRAPKNFTALSQNITDEQPVLINQSVFLDNVFNIPIQALQAVNQLVRHIAQNLRAVTSRMNPNPITARPLTENEIDEIDF